MCGILGVKIKRKLSESDYNGLLLLMSSLQVRGTHSFGICFYKNNIYASIKSFMPEYSNFIDLIKDSGTNSFIYHNRYSTSGDYGVMNNNQPILVESVGALAMNGVLSMKTKEEYEKDYGVKCACDNDTEVFLRILEKHVNNISLNIYLQNYTDIEKTLVGFLKSQPQCSFAGVFLIKDRIIALRNNKRPLYYFDTDMYSGFISMYDSFCRTGFNIRKPTIRIVKPFEMMVI